MKKTLVLSLLLIVLATGIAFCDEAAYNTAKVELLTQTTSSWDGSDLPYYPYGNPQVTVMKITVPSGVELAWHKHPVPLVAYMVAGELTVETDSGVKCILKAGDPIIETVNLWHYGANRGKEDVVLVAFYMGVEGVPNTVNKP